MLVAIVLPVAMQGISLALRLSGDARQRSEAATLARGKLDELIATADWQSGPFAGDFSPNQTQYQWTATVQPWIDGTMTEVDLKVSWTARSQQKSVTVSTLVDSGTATYATGG